MKNAPERIHVYSGLKFQYAQVGEININLHLNVAPDGFVSFYIVEQMVDDWNFETYDAYRYETDKPNTNPVGTIRKMHRELATYVAIHKPAVLILRANSDKKYRIYRNLLTRYPPAGYTSVEWDDTIFLYKLEAV